MSFPTPDAAESAFYEAFASGDLEGMMSVWIKDDNVVCIHPVSAPLHGIALVRRSWSLILSPETPFSIRFDNVRRHQGPILAVHVGTEHFDASGTDPAVAATTATNVYQLTDSGWLMLMHHASPIRESNPADGIFH